jgi:hypothetical protein
MVDGKKGIAISLKAFELGVTAKVGVLYRGRAKARLSAPRDGDSHFSAPDKPTVHCCLPGLSGKQHHLWEANYFSVISRMVLSPMISRISRRLTAS